MNRDFYAFSDDEVLGASLLPGAGASIWDEPDNDPLASTPAPAPVHATAKSYRKAVDYALAVASVLAAGFVVYIFATTETFTKAHTLLAVTGLVIPAYSTLFRFQTAHRVSVAALGLETIVVSILLFIFGMKRNPSAMLEIFLFMFLMVCAIGVSVALIYWAKTFEPAEH